MNDLVHDLGRGVAGTVVYQSVLAQDSGAWTAAHTAARTLAGQAATVDPPSASLYRGAPAVAYALHTAGHRAYRSALAELDRKIGPLVASRLSAARRRMDSGHPPRMREYDLIRGLTGLGAYLLSRGTGPDLLDGVLRYLVQLLQQPVTVEGNSLPGWWTLDSPSGEPDARWPLGHGNFGVAHGVAGPVALLALCSRAGRTVPGQHEALIAACRLLEEWLRPLPDGGDAWPETITADGWRGGPPSRAHLGRPSWCYGTPGIARSLQLAALACGRTDTQHCAEEALLACISHACQLDRLQDATVCHGWAGVCLTADRAAADAASGSALPDRLSALCSAFTTHVAEHPLPRDAGLLTGSDGILLTIHTLNPNHRVASGWETCLLLN
ncbi:lanthionine synthetase C family protein [Streptomyces sp. NPDC015032]|uniref:lanthionine synthetase C family protein n=1 Tax=Streptomyces sp. NPDC015032 TaxID=3364937 RepID=UPI003702E133